MIIEKYEANGRTRAERRRNDYLKAKRKKDITESVYSMGKEHPYYDNLHQYSKNKIHCSCPLCSAKTKKSAFGGKYNYTMSESKKQQSLDSQINEYLMEEADTRSIFEKYDDYLDQHIGNVNKGYEWLKENIPELFDNVDVEALDTQIKAHDESKFSDAEYEPYANYFYNDEDKYKDEFDLAWLHHQHNNPHHWQYWILQNDEDGRRILDMPYEYIIEMVCDWWAFSWSKENLNEIFNWYEQHEDGILISDATRETLEEILERIKSTI